MKKYELQPTDLKTPGGPTEELKASDLKTEVKCDPTFHDPTRLQSYHYCPMCGVKR
jgi:hypothetical protein